MQLPWTPWILIKSSRTVSLVNCKHGISNNQIRPYDIIFWIPDFFSLYFNVSHNSWFINETNVECIWILFELRSIHCRSYYLSYPKINSYLHTDVNLWIIYLLIWRDCIYHIAPTYIMKLKLRGMFHMEDIYRFLYVSTLLADTCLPDRPSVVQQQNCVVRMSVGPPKYLYI